MRIDGWEKMLTDFIESKSAASFQWGVHDCCLFAADCVEVITGHDYASQLRGRYKNGREAQEVIKEYGSMEEMVSALLGASCEVAFAHRGDVVMFDTSDGPALGICCGKQSVFAGRTGLVYHSTIKCSAAWRIE